MTLWFLEQFFSFPEVFFPVSLLKVVSILFFLLQCKHSGEIVLSCNLISFYFLSFCPRGVWGRTRAPGQKRKNWSSDQIPASMSLILPSPSFFQCPIQCQYMVKIQDENILKKTFQVFVQRFKNKIRGKTVADGWAGAVMQKPLVKAFFLLFKIWISLANEIRNICLYWNPLFLLQK